MQNNVENTKEFDAKELSSKTTKKTNTKKKTSSKKTNGLKKIKPVYLVPIIFVLIVGIVLFAVFKISSNDGPVYGERCAGMTEIADSAISSTIETVKQENSNVTELAITVNCKTIKVNMTMADGADVETAKEAAYTVLAKLDEAVGLSKSNSDSAYSDLLGTLNGKTQYHVDFTIKGTEGAYPIFAAKHPLSDTINFTLNEARDPDLVESLHEQQAEEETESTEE